MGDRKEKLWKCRGCGKEFNYDSYIWLRIYREAAAVNLCRECYCDSKGLVRQQDHYVLYERVDDFGACSEGDLWDSVDDVNPPHISWSAKHKKWKLEFSDSGRFGHSGSFTWYYDNKEDIYKEMEEIR